MKKSEWIVRFSLVNVVVVVGCLDHVTNNQTIERQVTTGGEPESNDTVASSHWYYWVVVWFGFSFAWFLFWHGPCVYLLDLIVIFWWLFVCLCVCVCVCVCRSQSLSIVYLFLFLCLLSACFFLVLFCCCCFQDIDSSFLVFRIVWLIGQMVNDQNRGWTAKTHFFRCKYKSINVCSCHIS